MAGGIDWFRWHHGSVTDPKFQLVARRAGASLPDVLAVWAYLLEAASAATERGTFDDIDCEAWDCLFGFPVTESRTFDILAAMKDRFLIGDGIVIRWEKRQPKREREGDNSTARVQAHRATKRQETPAPTKVAPETPREEESRKEPSSPSGKKISKASPSHPASPGVTAEFDEFWTAWPKGERKQDKSKCMAHWKLHNLTAIGAAILADVRVKRGTVKWGEGFIESPLIYLRGKRWEDGVEPETPGAHKPAVTVADNPGIEKTQALLAAQDAHAEAAAAMTDEQRSAVSARLAHARQVAAEAAARIPPGRVRATPETTELPEAL